MSSRRRDPGAAEPPGQIPQRAAIQVAVDADEAAAAQATCPGYIRGTAAARALTPPAGRQERQVSVPTYLSVYPRASVFPPLLRIPSTRVHVRLLHRVLRFLAS